MKLGTCSILLSVSALTACGATPTVQYRQINEGSDMASMTDAFFLQRSELLINAPNAGGEGASEAIVVNSIPRESQRKLGIRAHDSIVAATTISIVKFDNTDLVKSIGVETTDDTLKAITEVGGVVVKLIPFLAGAPPTPGAAPATLEPCFAPGESLRYELVTDPDSKDSKVYSVPGKNCIEVEIGAVPPDALKWSEIPFEQNTSMFLYSACRTATITVAGGPKGKKSAKVVKISDPNFVQMVRLPFKGVISMHPQCGVSVVTEKMVSDTTPSAVVNALLVQAKAIDDARKAADKSETSPASSASGTQKK